MQTDVCAVDDYYHQQQHDQQTAEHTVILADAGEDEVGVLPGKDRGAVPFLYAGEAAGGEGELALRRLPGDAPAIRVNGGVIRGDEALFLVVLEEVCPQQGNGRRNGRAADGEPVQPDAEDEEHDQKNGDEYCGASKVAGDDDYHAEHDHEMPRHLHDGHEGVYILILFKIGHLLCRDDYVQNLYDLRRLNAYTGEADPAFVAGAVVLPEEDERDDQQHVYHAQRLPLFAQQVRVDHREDDEHADAEEHGEHLNDDELRRVFHAAPPTDGHAGDGLVDGRNAEERTYDAHNEQENVRPLKKRFHIRLYLFYNNTAFFAESDMLFVTLTEISPKTAAHTCCILAHNWALRNAARGV